MEENNIDCDVFVEELNNNVDYNLCIECKDDVGCSVTNYKQINVDNHFIIVNSFKCNGSFEFCTIKHADSEEYGVKCRFTDGNIYHDIIFENMTNNVYKMDNSGVYKRMKYVINQSCFNIMRSLSYNIKSKEEENIKGCLERAVYIIDGIRLEFK